MITELSHLIELLVPSPDRFEVIHASDEYKKIVMDAMKDNRNLLRECLEEVDRLKALANRYSGSQELLDKINRFAAVVSNLEATALAIGIDDDEFENVSMSDSASENQGNLEDV